VDLPNGSSGSCCSDFSDLEVAADGNCAATGFTIRGIKRVKNVRKNFVINFKPISISNFSPNLNSEIYLTKQPPPFFGTTEYLSSLLTRFLQVNKLLTSNSCVLWFSSDLFFTFGDFCALQSHPCHKTLLIEKEGIDAGFGGRRRKGA